jgi:hypothetical protein
MARQGFILPSTPAVCAPAVCAQTNLPNLCRIYVEIMPAHLQPMVPQPHASSFYIQHPRLTSSTTTTTAAVTVIMHLLACQACCCCQLVQPSQQRYAWANVGEAVCLLQLRVERFSQQAALLAFLQAGQALQQQQQQQQQRQRGSSY